MSYTHRAIIFRDDFSIHECNQALVDSRLVEVRRYNHLDHCTSSDIECTTTKGR